ncbi:MAG: glycosyltransferase family 4 protein [Candidatus Phaeomarinobacter sp.]
MQHFYLATLVAFTLALNMVAFVTMWAKTHQLDVPNERSSHIVPTPRGGGIAIVVTALIATAVLYRSGHLPAGLAAALGFGGGLVALIGHVDDRRGLPALLRLVVQFTAAGLAVLMIGGVSKVPVGHLTWEPGILGGLIAVIGLTWMINLTNFMDGIDGLAASHTIFVSLSGAGLLWLAGAESTASYLLLLAAASAGFLVFNWPPATIFMGDVSSGFLGLVIGIIAIATAEHLNLWAWGILLTPFMADATVTRAMRYKLYGDLFGAHRAHVYQRLSRRLGGHQPVVHRFWAISIGIYLPLAVYVAHAPFSGWLIMPATWATSFVIAYRLGAGRDDKEDAARVTS